MIERPESSLKPLKLIIEDALERALRRIAEEAKTQSEFSSPQEFETGPPSIDTAHPPAPDKPLDN